MSSLEKIWSNTASSGRMIEGMDARQDHFTPKINVNYVAVQDFKPAALTKIGESAKETANIAPMPEQRIY